VLKRIRVLDRNGDELVLYEMERRLLFRTMRRFSLCGGERVRAIDARTFEVTETGEQLRRL